MTENELKNFVKINLTNTGTAYDAEINAWIAAAEADITNSTGKEFDIADPVQCAMVVLYVRAFFGDGDTTASERYVRMLKKLGIQSEAAE